MKRLLSLMLVLILVFALVACGKGKNGSTDVNQNATQSKDENTDITNSELTKNENVTENSLTDTSSEESIPTETSKQEHISNNNESNSGVNNSSSNVEKNFSPKTNATENSSTDTSSEEKVPTEIPKQEPTSNNNQSNSGVNNSTSNATNKFSPKVIASRCAHNYLPPTCTSLIPCTICGELLTGLYQGQVITYGHSYRNNKCIDCGFERKDMLDLNGAFYGINEPLTVDIRLMTSEQEIEIYPCVTLYKYVNGNWQPYEGMYAVGEFFALEATHGEVLVSNGVQYGRWDYMTNNILKTNPNAIIETDFGPSRLIRRFKLSIPETGEYRIEITDGLNDSKKNPNKDYIYIINIY